VIVSMNVAWFSQRSKRFSSGPARDASRIRAALLAGFAVVSRSGCCGGYQLVRNLTQIEQNVANVHNSYVRGEQTLSEDPDERSAGVHLSPRCID
jgi:hypothetical protein